MQRQSRWMGVAVLLAWFGFAGCGDSTGPGAGTVSLSVAVPASGGAASAVSPALFDVVIGSGPDAVTVSKVELVLREIELERVNDDSCDDEFEGDDRCEEFETGPRLLDLPLDGSAEQVLSVSGVPDDLYDELEVEIHKLSGDPADGVITSSRPDLIDVSIRVEGSVDTAPFVFTTGIEEEFEFTLAPPVDTSVSPVNVTLSIDVASWFQDGDGSPLDPTDEANRSRIENNIRQSFEAFEDDDGDGTDD